MGTVVVVAPFFASFFRTQQVVPGVANIGLTPVDFVAGALGIVLVRYVIAEGTITVSKMSTYFFGFLLLLIGWHVVRIEPAEAPLRSITLALQLVRNALLVGCVLVFTRSTDVPVINRLVSGGTAVIGALTVVLWMIADTYSTELWEPLGAFHIMLTGTKKGFDQPLIRSQWLVGDPNFYSILLVVGLFCAVEIAIRRGRRQYYVEAAVIAVALF
ncbi:hypothetical protein VB779_16460 [Haloarculaceae archaeon H-GB11]|nr:hypothetical protein [Haloarculaceae archaeon H-GB11]